MVPSQAVHRAIARAHGALGCRRRRRLVNHLRVSELGFQCKLPRGDHIVRRCGQEVGSHLSQLLQRLPGARRGVGVGVAVGFWVLEAKRSDHGFSQLVGWLVGGVEVETGLERGEHDFSQRGGEGVGYESLPGCLCVRRGGQGDGVVSQSVYERDGEVAGLRAWACASK